MRANRWGWIARVVVLVGSLAALAAGCGFEGGGSGQAPRLTRTEPAIPGSCPHGGVVKSVGADDNGNGVLDDDEIERSALECNDGPELSRRVPLAPGPQCAIGGAEVQAGIDRNGNGTLDDDEVTRTAVVCDASRRVAEPESPHCVAGGEQVQTGPDDNANGVLDDDEVARSVYECSTIFRRDVVLRTAAQAEAMAQITEIRGALSIYSEQASDLREASLPQLREVTGALHFGSDPWLTTVSLPELTVIGGDLVIGGVAGNRLGSIALPKLASVGGKLAVQLTSSLANLAGLPLLHSVGGDLRLESNAALRSMRGPQRVSGQVVIRGNPLLQRITLVLEEPTGDVRVESNATLDEVVLTVPEAPAVTVAANPRLAKLTLADPGSAGRPGRLGHIEITTDARLAQQSITAERIASLSLSAASALPQTRIITDEIEGNLFLLQSTGSLAMEKRTAAGPALRIGGWMIVRGQITDLRLPPQGLRVEGILEISHSKLVALPAVEHVGGNLTLTSNSLLSDVGALAFLGASVQIVNNDALTDLDFIDQPEIFGSLIISGNANLQRAQLLTGLQRITRSLDLRHNPRLEQIVSPLTHIGGSLFVEEPGLERLQLDQLTQTTNVALTNLLLLPELSFPALQTTGAFSLRGNTAAQRLSLPALQSLTSLHAEQNSALPTCQLEALCAQFGLLGTSCTVRGNGSGPCP